MTVHTRSTDRDPEHRAPRLPRTAIDRPTVFEMLDRWSPLTFVRAPAGYGKTFAVTGWVRTCVSADVSVVWAEVASDAGSERELWEAIRDAAVGAGLAADRASDADRVFLEAVSASTGRVLLVIDSAENLREDAAVGRLIEMAARFAHVHVIIVTRRILAPSRMPTRLVDTTTVLAEELRFDQEEAAGVFARSQIVLDAEVIGSINEAYAGWPAAVHRTALLLAGKGTDRQVMAEVNADVERYVWDLVSTGLPDEVRSFAARTALIGHLVEGNACLAFDEPQDIEQVRAMLRSMESVGLITSPVGLRDRVYSFVPAIAEYFKIDAEANPAIDAQSLHRRVIDFHIAREEWPQAYAQALELADPELLAELVETAWYKLVFTQPELIASALSAIPPAMIEQRPVLVVARDSFIGATDGSRVVDMLPDDPDELAALGRRDDVAERVAKQLLIMSGSRMSGHLDLSAAMGDKLRTIVDIGLTEQPEAVRPFAAAVYVHAGISRQLVDDLDGAVPYFHQGHQIQEYDVTSIMARNAEGALALHHAVSGELDSAREWAEREGSRPPTESWIERRLMTTGNLARVWLGLEALQPASVQEELSGLVAQRDDDEYWSFIAQVQTVFALMWGDKETMLGDLMRVRQERRRLAPPGSHAQIAMLLNIVDLRLVLGHGTAAAALLDTAPADHHDVVVRRARLRLLCEEPEEVLAAALPVATATVRNRLEMQLLYAAAYLDLADTESAGETIRRAEGVARATGLRTPFVSLSRRRLEGLTELSGPESLLATMLSDGFPTPTPDSVERIALTERESFVLDRLAAGLNAEAIAAQSFVSLNTSKSQIRSLYRKLGVHSRTDALVRARDLGLRS